MTVRIFLFLDYDGTLVPIKSSPEKAVLPPPVRAVLRTLAAEPGVRVAIVTGRSLAVIKSMVGLDTLIYAGNHGLEIEGPGIPYRAMAGAQCRATVARIAGALGVALASVPGVLVENKGLTLSLHYRRVGRAALPRVFAAFDRITRPYVHEKLIGIHPGKQVLEARPAVRWDKGDAVRWLLKKYHAAPADAVYIGDDATDEPAFAALGRRGLTVFVGAAAATGARYRVRDSRQVLTMLTTLKEVCRARQ